MKTRREQHKVRDRERVRVTYRFRGLGLSLWSGLIFSLSSQMAYFIYRFLVDGTEKKNPTWEKMHSDFRSAVSLGPTKHRLSVNHFCFKL